MSRLVTFRVDELGVITHDRIKSFLSTHTGQHCVAFEVSDKTQKPHYQGWAFTDLNHQSWCNLIKKEFPEVTVGATRGRGKGHYSGAPVRKDLREHYHPYICKGTKDLMPRIISSQFSVSETELNDFAAIHAKYWDRFSTTSRHKAIHMVEKGIEVFSNHAWLCDEHDYSAKRMEVAMWLSTEYNGKGKNSFLFKNYINGILTCCSEAYNKEFCRQLAECDRW